MGIEIFRKVVSGNDGNRLCYVLSRMPRYEYTRHGDYIEGTDGIFYDCYIYNRIGGAFGGRKFEIKLKTGDIVNCDGHWFSGGHDNATTQIITMGISTVERLSKCYVFQSSCADKGLFCSLPGYDSRLLYEYNDFKKVVTYERVLKKYIQKSLKGERDKKVLIKEIQKKHKVLNYILDQYNKKLNLI